MYLLGQCTQWCCCFMQAPLNPLQIMLSTAYHMVAIDNHLNSPAANTTSSTAFDVKQQHLRYVVAAVCFLSMIGAILIVLSYVCIKQIRTRARQILVHLSLADFGVACSNFIGTTVYFDQYIRGCNDSTSHVIPCATLHHLCKTQAFFAGYSTLVSVLWTLFLALYIYCLIVYSQRRLHVIVVYCGYIICWGMPLLVIAWLLVEGTPKRMLWCMCEHENMLHKQKQQCSDVSIVRAPMVVIVNSCPMLLLDNWCVYGIYRINRSYKVYCANIRLKTEVKGSLRLALPVHKAKGVTNTPITGVKGRILHNTLCNYG